MDLNVWLEKGVLPQQTSFIIFIFAKFYFIHCKLTTSDPCCLGLSHRGPITHAYDTYIKLSVVLPSPCTCMAPCHCQSTIFVRLGMVGQWPHHHHVCPRCT